MFRDQFHSTSFPCPSFVLSVKNGFEKNWGVGVNMGGNGCPIGIGMVCGEKWKEKVGMG